MIINLLFPLILYFPLSHIDQLMDFQFIIRLNPQIHLKELLEESAEYWLNLLQKYFTDEMVVLMGTPSIELQNK